MTNLTPRRPSFGAVLMTLRLVGSLITIFFATAAIAGPATKLEEPTAASKAEALALIKQVYTREYNLRTPNAKRTLAVTLLTEAEKPDTKDASRFVLFQEANTAAVTASDPYLSRKAIGGLSRWFDMNTDPMSVDAISKLADGRADDRLVVEWAMMLARRSLSKDDYPTLRRLVRAMATRVNRVRDLSLRTDAQAMETLLTEYEHAKASLEKVKSDTADPAADLAAGRFLCFYRRDWKTGLPLLVKGSDPKLSDLAKRDLGASSSADVQYTLAGDYWDLGQDKPHATLADVARERAVYWYASAVEGLSDLQKGLARKRIDEYQKSIDPGAIRLTELAGNSVVQPDGSVLVSKGMLKYMKNISVPFRVDSTLKITTKGCSIRMSFLTDPGNVFGQVIFNWEDHREDLWYVDPGNDNMAFKDKGVVPVDQFIHLTWIVTETESRIMCDGEERAVKPGKHAGMTGPFFFDVFSDPALVVKSLSIKQGSAAVSG